MYSLFKLSLKNLVQIQVKGHEGLDYKKSLTNKEFGKQAILADLLYFKYYFLDALRKPYDKQKLLDDLEDLLNIAGILSEDPTFQHQRIAHISTVAHFTQAVDTLVGIYPDDGRTPHDCRNRVAQIRNL